MEYKIRANNQKEAVEVYKAIRQIQQGKYNIAVNADSRKDAVRIYKEAKRVCDSKLKDEDYKLMRAIIDVCKKYNYYTYGTLEDYNKLLNNADKMDLVDIATNISVHSDENDSRKIEQILKKELGYRGITKDSKLKDFGMHNPATTDYHPEYSPSDFKRYVTNIVKLDLSTKTFTTYNPSKANAIKKLETCVNQVIDDFKADITNPRVIRNEAVTWYNNNYTKILDTLLKTPSIIQHMDGTSLVKANNLLQQMQQSIK